MKNDLITKLGQLCAATNISESQVAHFMILSRKLMQKVKISYRTLEFFCDWAVHIELDRKRAQIAIERVNKYLNDTKTEHPYVRALLLPFEDPLLFEQLRTDIHNLISDHKLIHNFTLDEKLWHNFANKLLKILLDCPLIFKGGSACNIASVAIKNWQNKALYCEIVLKNDDIIKMPLYSIEYKPGVFAEKISQENNKHKKIT